MTRNLLPHIADEALRFLRLTSISFAIFATLPGAVILVVELVA